MKLVIEEAPFGGGGDSAAGAGVGFISTGGGGDSSPEGAGDGTTSGVGGEAVEVWLLLSAITTTTNFSFFLQCSSSPLMK